MNPLDHVYRRLRETYGEEVSYEFWETVVLDEEARTLFSSPALLERFITASSEEGAGFDVLDWASLYTWAVEALLEGEPDPGLAPVAARALTARGCVQRPDGVGALLRAHERAVEQGAHETVDHLSGLFPAVVGLLVETGRHKEAGRVMGHLEQLGDRLALGRCLLRAGAPEQEAVARYVDSEAGNLCAALNTIHRHPSLRRRLLTLALVCRVAFPERDESEEMRALQRAFRGHPRRFNALFWGDEARGALTEDALGLELAGLRLHQEACRERWYFDRVVRRAGRPDTGAFPCELLTTAALRSDQVAWWLAEEPATGPGGLVGGGRRFRLLLRRARIPRGSLYAQVLDRTLRDGPVFAEEEVRALRRVVDTTEPTLPGFWVTAGVLTGLGLVVGTLLEGHVAWSWILLCGLLTVVPAGLFAAVALLMEAWLFGWTRSVLLPRRNPRRAEFDFRWLVKAGFDLSLVRLGEGPDQEVHFKDRLPLVPLWELARYREAIQADHTLAARLMGALGGRAIHTADDVSVLLARHMPRENA